MVKTNQNLKIIKRDWIRKNEIDPKNLKYGEWNTIKPPKQSNIINKQHIRIKSELD